MKLPILFPWILASVVGTSPANDGEGEPRTIVLRAAKVVTCADGIGVIDHGTVVVRGRKIVAVGRTGEVEVPAGAVVHDLGRRWIVPGFVEAHAHIAGGPEARRHINETSHSTNPELHAHSTIKPNNEWMQRALAGGVTTVMYIPGSGSNMGGFGTIVKMWDDGSGDSVVRFPGALKIAQAGNPERGGGELGRGRMGMNWMIRWTVQQGLDYAKLKREKAARGEELGVDFDPRYEDLAELFDPDDPVPIMVHTQIFQVVQATLRMLHDEFGAKPAIDHGTFDGYKNAPLAAERGVPVLNGPRQIWYDRDTGRIMGCAAGWSEGGVEQIGVNTDSWVVPEEELWYQMAMAVHFGLRRELGIRGITIVPARAMKVSQHVGSIEVGKDADLGIWSGDPIDPRSVCEKTFVNGFLAYCKERDGQRF